MHLESKYGYILSDLKLFTNLLILYVLHFFFKNRINCSDLFLLIQFHHTFVAENAQLQQSGWITL